MEDYELSEMLLNHNREANRHATRRKRTAAKVQKRVEFCRLILKPCKATRVSGLHKTEMWSVGNDGYTSKPWVKSLAEEKAIARINAREKDYYAEERIPIKERFHQMVAAYNALVREKSIEELDEEAVTNRAIDYSEYTEWLENMEAKERYGI